ncbi:DUF998 domain-containing protein [Microbacterium sp. 4R-513]|uniref:DUF998 domain-containing protein n=1 Tax=Microbacterium sp. 4R-513 TaxID=2567934 RepID=UPI001F49F3AD|nr:DUF998 domain-containing protein [Microbacterium sp. 4R-513]
MWAPAFLDSADIFRGSRVDSRQLAITSVVILVLGTAIAAATTSDSQWWTLHFSELGTHRDLSGMAFNIGSMSAGGLLVVFAARVRQELATILRRLEVAVHAQTHLARVLVALIASFGCHLALVGLVPLNVDTALHERGASGTMLSFLGILLIMLASPWTPRRLRWISAAIAVVLVPAIVVFVLGLVTLATLEIIGFGLIFVWLVTFSTALRNAASPKAAARAQARPAPARAAARARRRVSPARGRGASGASAAPARRVSAPKRSARQIPTRAPALRPRSQAQLLLQRPAPVTAARRPVLRAVPRHPSRPSSVPLASRGPLPRGCRASGGRAASGSSTRSVLRSRR